MSAPIRGGREISIWSGDVVGETRCNRCDQAGHTALKCPLQQENRE